MLCALVIVGTLSTSTFQKVIPEDAKSARRKRQERWQYVIKDVRITEKGSKLGFSIAQSMCLAFVPVAYLYSTQRRLVTLCGKADTT